MFAPRNITVHFWPLFLKDTLRNGSNPEGSSMRLRLLIVLTAALALGQQAKADSIYSYALGLSLQNTCLPGSEVSINAFLLNTGSAAITFAPNFPGGLPSAQGGSVPFLSFNDGDSQWSILNNGFSSPNFFAQFGGVTVDPGQVFQFTFGTFEAPQNQPLGASAIPQLNFGIDFTDSIEGNLLGICPGDCGFNNTAHPIFTLGNTSSNTDLTYFQGTTIDRSPVSVPEPSTWQLTIVALTTTAGFFLYQNKKRSRVSATSIFQ
jgi:hypothetical protein